MLEIKRLRREKGWNQTELAFHASLAPSVISQVENGKRNPSAGTLKKLADALGVEVGDLFPKAEAPLPFEEDGPEQRRSPFMEAWTSYMLRRAQELEEFLPEKVRGMCRWGSITDPDEQELAEEWAEELAADPELASKLLLQNEIVRFECEAAVQAVLQAMKTARRIDAPEMRPVAGAKHRRADLHQLEDAFDRMLDAQGKWAVAEKAARIAGDMYESPDDIARAEEADRARRKVVELFEGRRSA
jgi:transcriptional regulator with XRE-family HTH domain